MNSTVFLTFDAKFPNDEACDRYGNVIVPAGRSIASDLVDRLAKTGLPCSEPRQHSFYGWSFEARHDRIVVWCLLQYPDPWLLIIEPRIPLAQKLIGRKWQPAYEEIVQLIMHMMESDERFGEIKSTTRKEFERRHKRVH